MVHSSTTLSTKKTMSEDVICKIYYFLLSFPLQCLNPMDSIIRHIIKMFHLKGSYFRNDLFEDTALLCQRVNKEVWEVFSSPENVMAKLIQNIFEIRLQVIFHPYGTHLKLFETSNPSCMNRFSY